MPRIRVSPARPQLDLFPTVPAVAPPQPVGVTALLQVSEPAAKVLTLEPAVGHTPGATRRVKRVAAPEVLAPEPPAAPSVKANVVPAIDDPGVGGAVEPFATPDPPWSYFTKSRQLNADEATRVIGARTLGYVGVRFHKTGACVCRDCHEGMTKDTGAYTPKGFAGQGYLAVVYSSEQRAPNVTAKCAVCGVLVIGEVAGG